MALPWESTYQYQCKKDMIDKHGKHHGEERVVALANVWANYHFLGCSYPQVGVLHNLYQSTLSEHSVEWQTIDSEIIFNQCSNNTQDALNAVKSWGPPPKDQMYEDKMMELKERQKLDALKPK